MSYWWQEYQELEDAGLLTAREREAVSQYVIEQWRTWDEGYGKCCARHSPNLDNTQAEAEFYRRYFDAHHEPEMGARVERLMQLIAAERGRRAQPLPSKANTQQPVQ